MLYLLCLSYVFHSMQAMHAHSSVAVGLKGATKAMVAMNKVTHSILHFKYTCPYNIFVPGP